MSFLRLVIHWLAVILLLLCAAGVGAWTYLTERPAPESRKPPAVVPASAEQAVIFIIDGFHPRHAFDPAVMPNLTHLAAEGAAGIAATGPYSLSTPCVFHLATGRPGTLRQALRDFHPPEVLGPSLPSLTMAGGRRVALAGSSWPKMFGWTTAPSDRLDLPFAGLTLDARLQAQDRQVVEFVLVRIGDPRYGLLVAHTVSTDAVGHLVTPSGAAYRTSLAFQDQLLGELLDRIRTSTLPIVLLVTGDHSLAARGGHGGGEEEARRPPFVFWGAGIRAGVRQDLPQAAIPTTLGVLLGFPLLEVSEQPPATALLSLSPEQAQAVHTAYFTAKRHVAGLEPVVAVAHEAAENQRLNQRLFGPPTPRTSGRLLTAVLTAAALLLALAGVWRAQVQGGSPTLTFPLLAGITLAPWILLLVSASFFLQLRAAGHLGLASRPLALVLGLLACGLGILLWRLVLRTQADLEIWVPALVATATGVLTLPLLANAWVRPDALYLGGLAGLALAVLWQARQQVITYPLLGLALFTALLFPAAPELALGCASLTVLGLIYFLLRRSSPLLSGRFGLLVMVFAAAWAWRLLGGPTFAGITLGGWLGTLIAGLRTREPRSASIQLIGGAAALFLVLADTPLFALAFLGAAALALLLVNRRPPEELRPTHLALIVLAAVLARVGLVYLLGDAYTLGNVRTGAGFRLTASGFSPVFTTLLLVIKFTLPWLLLLAALLPCLAAAGTSGPRTPRPGFASLGLAQTLHLLTLAYTARFAALAALVDPFRLLPNGMRGLLGVFALTLGEWICFVLAGALIWVGRYQLQPSPQQALDDQQILRVDQAGPSLNA